jgi:hypothetical protein
MPDKASRRELAGVWLVGTCGELAAVRIATSGEPMVSVPILTLVGGFFLAAPLFLVVYTLIWAWPMVVRGNRRVLLALWLFGVIVETTALYLSAAPPGAISSLTLLMRLLAIFTPVFFALHTFAWRFWRYKMAATAAGSRPLDPVRSAPRRVA